MTRTPRAFGLLILAGLCSGLPLGAQDREPLFSDPVNVAVPTVGTDPEIRWDYDIVYVRAPRAGDKVHKRYYTDFSQPVTLEPGADLMLLHPDGRDELLVAGGNGSITDPVVSFDGQWVYYVHVHDLRGHNQWSPPRGGADIFKIHLSSRRIVRLTDQTFSPNTGAATWSSDLRTPESGKTNFDYGVFNMGPCPLPGGKIAFTSNRDGFRPSKGYPVVALQLFVMDDSDEGLGRNVEKIGHLNIAGALHPVVLTDGRIMFSSLESQGLRSDILWGIWTIHPDGTNWAPLVSAFDPGGAPNGFHFQTQLSDGSIIVEEYYNQNNSGFGALIKLPLNPPPGTPAFGPAYMRHERNKPWRYGRHDNGKGRWYSFPFMPTGSISLTPFSHGLEGPADPAVLGDKNSPKVGKFTHPSGAPDNHLLTVYSPGPVNHQYTYLPQLDGGIYLAKGGHVVREPSELRLIKNDPNYNESWPRAVVPYRRIYGIDQPNPPPAHQNDGHLSKHLPEGTPFGLIGTSSLYKRESYPNGVVPDGAVTATYAGGNDPWKGLDAFTSHGNGMPLNLHNQGGDVGLFENRDIHAIRILAMEPTTDRQRGENTGRRFYSHAQERLRILGEIPVRKFGMNASAGAATPDGQPLDPDGQPDTSFLAKIPADTAFTFQLIDRNGMVLSHSQTWHQLRPGEVRYNCGGCHAHSQRPTEFSETAAAKPDYPVWDLVQSTPLVTTKSADQSRQKWDADDRTGLILDGRNRAGQFADVEYFRDVQPILRKSCVACHTQKSAEPPAGLVLDADEELIPFEHIGKFPGTYFRLAVDERAKFGVKPIGYDSWGYPNASRYLRKLQSRRSLLIWKVFGQRLDGFSNDDHPSEPTPGAGYLAQRGERVDLERNRSRYDLDFLGTAMPPPDAVAGKQVGPDGRPIKVEPLTDQDRMTLVRWIDLGCPIDLDGLDASRRGAPPGLGWHLDDSRPTLAITAPAPDAGGKTRRILVGMHDFHSGLDLGRFDVRASLPLAGVAAGQNLADRFQAKSPGVWQLVVVPPEQKEIQLTVSISDRRGNVTRVERRLALQQQ